MQWIEITCERFLLSKWLSDRTKSFPLAELVLWSLHLDPSTSVQVVAAAEARGAPVGPAGAAATPADLGADCGFVNERLGAAEGGDLLEYVGG